MKLWKKKRKHDRYHVQKGVFVIVGVDRKVQIIDISTGGVGFIYNGPREDIENENFLSFLSDKERLERLPIEVKNVKPSGSVNRVGAEFKWLGILQKGDLCDYIEGVKICKVA